MVHSDVLLWLERMETKAHHHLPVMSKVCSLLLTCLLLIKTKIKYTLNKF